MEQINHNEKHIYLYSTGSFDWFPLFFKLLETSEILIKDKTNLENRFLNNYFGIHVDIAGKLRKHLTVI